MRAAQLDANKRVVNVIELEEFNEELFPNCVWGPDAHIGQEYNPDTGEFFEGELTPDQKSNKLGALISKIDTLERDSLLNRGSRELQLATMEKEAVTLAAANGVTKEQVLAKVIYYVKLKALDTQITELRAEMVQYYGTP